MTNTFQPLSSAPPLSRGPLPLPPPSSSYGGPPTPPASATTSSKTLLFSRYHSAPQSTPSSSNTSPSDTEEKNCHYNYTKVKHEDEDEMTTDKMDRLIERKRKRRESHNVVERKRRDNINARIDELGALLPPQKQSLKLNRGIILQNSVDHIKFLYHRVAEQQQRIHELEQLLGRNTPNDDLPHHHHPSRNDISHTQDLHQQHQQEKYLQPSYHQQQLPQPATVPYAQSSSSYAANQQQE